MNTSKAIDVALWALLALGFLGAARVSYASMMGNPCPHLALIPICYVVLLAYGLMIGSVITRHHRGRHYLFCAGWSTAFVIALVGSVAEIAAGGGVCPTTGGGGVRATSSGSLPLCYVSLAMLLIVLVLFLTGPYKRTCDLHNASAKASQ